MSGFKTIEGRASGEIEAKKSRFIGQIAHVETEEEALAFLEEVRAANRMARHNVYAYVLEGGGAGERVRYSDDGEPQKTAGMPTLEALRHAELTNVALVTTRYFGGILLGTGGLVRAYTQAAQAAIAAAHIVEISECVDVTVVVPYALFDQIANAAEGCGARQVDVAYTDVVTLRLRMLAGTEAPLLEKIEAITRGQVAPQVSAPFAAPF